MPELPRLELCTLGSLIQNNVSLILGYRNPELIIQGEVVVGREEISIGKMAGGQPHQLGITAPFCPIPPRIPERDDGRDPSRTLHFHGSTVQGIIHPLALVGDERVAAAHHPADRHGHDGGSIAHIPEPQLIIQRNIVVGGEPVGIR